MIRRTLLLVTAAFGLLAAGVAAQDAPVLTPADCTISVPAGVTVECSTLEVPESRSGLSDATLSLAVATYPATGEATQPPLIFLQGGPGGGIIETSALVYDLFTGALNENRDVVYIDQRGTGLSTPNLTCPGYRDFIYEDLANNYSLDEYAARANELLLACRDTLTSQGITLAAYTSRENAADIADLAAALGAEQIDLFGGSYGTRLALTIIRDFPGLVNAAVLDSVLAPESNQVSGIANVAQNNVDTLFAACADDASCAATHPTLEADYYAVIERLNAEPATITMPTNALGSETMEAVIDGTDFQNALFFASYTTAFLPNIPGIIASASAGDYTVLGPYLNNIGMTYDDIALGMFISLICAEEVAAQPAEDISAAIAAVPNFETFALGSLYGSVENLTSICAAWGAAPFDPIEIEPVVSDVPALVLTGISDPVTPPFYAELAAASLSNSTLYAFPGVGHVGTLGDACMLSLTAQFLDNPGAPLDDACFAEAAATFAVPVTELTLVPVSSETFGVSSVAPEGWTEVAPGTFAEAITSQNSLVLLAAPAPAEALLTGIFSQFGAEPGEPTGTVETASGTWTVYSVELAVGISVTVGVQESDAGTNFVGIFTPPADSVAYYDLLFIPALEAFQPAG
ncbi:MAG: alpha/beta hydrolase [Pleurocapsa minor GSE-CHR-MK-17-07R]|jgi:pimeloyl-ACP methyl ester carboxylesterase|nr:alpha/beta hydrolase [Pleurocapsa minor GSE-CHR-MK 17-07R]